MARAEKKATIGELLSQSDLSTALTQSSCLRCGGLMVNEVSIDLMNSASELECVTRRCVQCGDILDPVILRNRHTRQALMTLRPAPNSLQSTYAMGHR